MWTLVVLLVGFTPPQGMIQYGFATEAECLLEASAYCDGGKTFRCKCTDKIQNPSQWRE